MLQCFVLVRSPIKFIRINLELLRAMPVAASVQAIATFSDSHPLLTDHLQGESCFQLNASGKLPQMSDLLVVVSKATPRLEKVVWQNSYCIINTITLI